VIVISIAVFALLVLACAWYASREESYRRGVVVHDDPAVQEPDLGFVATWRWWAMVALSGLATVLLNRVFDWLWPG
jgi:hypothetical protein